MPESKEASASQQDVVDKIKIFYDYDHRKLGERVPSTCSGSGTFWLYFFLVFVCGIVVPLCVLFPIASLKYEKEDSAFKIIIIVASCTVVISFAYLVSRLWPVLRKGLPCNMPPRPPIGSPFVHSEPFRKVNLKGKRIAAIYNPHGGLGQASRAFKLLEKECGEREVSCDGFQTKYAGHAHVLAEIEIPNLADYSALVAIGGDGTVFETVNGLLRREDKIRVPLGVIPAGSGNSFSADLGTWNFTAAVERILQGETMLVDINHITTVERSAFDQFLSTAQCEVKQSEVEGKRQGNNYYHTHRADNQDEDKNMSLTETDSMLNLGSKFESGQGSLPCPATDSYIRNLPKEIAPLEGTETSEVEPNVNHIDVFNVNLVSLGLVGDIGTTADLCRCMGPIRYDICGLWGLLKGYKKNFTLVYHDSQLNRYCIITQPMVTLFAMSTQYFGKGHRASPFSKLDDGKMDIIHVSCSRSDLLAIFQQIPSGSHINGGVVEHIQTSDAWFVRNISEEESRKVALPHRGGVINVDGEGFPMVDGALRIQVLPRELEVFAPASTISMDSLKPDR